MTNIPIPEEIALLGVDNDELMCNISDPPISSIELEVERGGYSIGRLIHQQIKKEHEGTFNIVINPIRIELRQSTEKHNIKDPLHTRSSEVHRNTLQLRPDHRIFTCQHSVIAQKL